MPNAKRAQWGDHCKSENSGQRKIKSFSQSKQNNDVCQLKLIQFVQITLLRNQIRPCPLKVQLAAYGEAKANIVIKCVDAVVTLGGTLLNQRPFSVR